MQTLKISVVLCAFVACAPLTMRATDTPAQAAARAQVEAKLKELDGQPAANHATAPAAVVIAPKPAAHTEPVMKPINKPKANPSEAADAKAKAKADKAAADLKARQDADKAAADLKAQKQAAKAAAAKAKADQAAAKTKKEINSADVGKDIGLQPIAAPALPIAASKEARLQALLEKYQSDQLSPEDYHKQRAAILAAP